MANKVWALDIDEGKHVVELEHRRFSGKRTIRIDGKVLVQDRKLFDSGSAHPFKIDEHTCVVLIRTNGLTFNYDLVVDGQAVH